MKLSIRTYLLLLVAGLAIPMTALIALDIYVDMEEAVDHTKSSLRMLANVVARNTGGKISAAKETLERLARRPAVMAVDEKHCDAAIKDLHDLNPGYSNIVYTDLSGRAICSAVAQPGGKAVNVGNTSWFRKVLAEKRFSVGQPHFGPITGKWVSVLSAPIWNEQHEMVGAIHLPLDLANFDPDLPRQFLPAESRYGFFNAEGVLVWRNSDPEKIIGTKPNAEAARRIVEVRNGDFESVAIDGVKRYFAVVSLPEADWIAFVGVPVDSIAGPARQRAVITSFFGVLVVIFLGLLARHLARRIELPVAALASAARHFRLGESTVQAQVSGPAEIVEVAEEFNAMVDARLRNETELARYRGRLEELIAQRTAELESKNGALETTIRQLTQAQKQIIHAEKLASLGALVAGVAHELNTPIGNARTIASTLSEQASELDQAVEGGHLKRSELTDYVAQLNDGTRLLDRNLVRAADLIHSFKQVAIDQTTAECRHFLLDVVVHDIVSTLRPGYKKMPYAIDIEVPQGLAIDGYPGPLGQVIANLVDNAMLHGLNGRASGRVLISAQRLADDRISLSVADDGVGIPESNLGRLFDPFFTTRLGQGGSGLGLNIVHNIVTGLMAGTIEVESTAGAGSRFTITFPRQVVAT